MPSRHRVAPPSAPAVAPSLADTQRWFRLLIENVPDYAIFVLDPEGRILTWTRAAERIKGYRAEEIIGQHFSRFYPPEAVERKWPEYELEVAAAEGRFEDEGWRVRKDGSRFWANVVITALKDEQGRLLGFGKITRDLTERRRHEEALRESEERFRLLVENVRDYAIFMLDPDGRVTSWNAGAERIKGYRPEEIIGQHFSRFYPPDAVERGWPEHELAVARREGRFEDEGWRIRKDGSRFWADVVITAVHDAERRLRGFAKVTRDLSQRRQVEALQDEGRRMDEFLAMLGHELRNPLAPIRNAVAVLGAGDPEVTLTWAREVIDRQVTHLGRLVDDLLDLGRIRIGKVAVKRDPVELSTLVARVVDSARTLFQGKGQTVELHLPPAGLHVTGDLTRLSQVVLNLLTNAHKYTPSGGHVRVDLRRAEPSAELQVTDDGIGMSLDLLPWVFDPFVQGERSPDRAEGGLGIGLTLVRKLVELHGGTVSASSAGPGKGSTFLVRLPLTTQTSAGASGEPRAEAAPGPALRVLVVDDNLDSAETMVALLRAWGHDVRAATEGPEALSAAAAFAPNVVLLDIGLPGMSGYEVAERLRDSESVLIAVTGYGQREDALRARQAGFSQHLVKPVDPHRLRQLLSDISAERLARRP
jgi:PAS domain S-box-containing protein